MTLSQSASKIIRFLIMLYVIRSSNVELWGQIALLMTWISYFQTLSDFGLSTLASVNELKSKVTEHNYYSIHITKHVIISTILVIVFTTSTTSNQWIWLGIYSSILILKGISPEWMFYRNENAGFLNTANTIRNFGQLLFLIAMPYQLSIGIFVISELLFEAIYTVVLKTRVPHTILDGIRKIKINIWKRTFLDSGPVFIMSLAVFLHTNVDVFILDYLSTKETVGIYTSNYRVFMFYYMIGGTLSILFRTRAAYLIQEGNSRVIGQWMIANMKILFAISTFFLLICTTILKPLLILLFNDYKILDNQILTILSAYLIIAYISIILSERMLAIGRRKELLVITLTGATVNISLNLILIPIWGVNGAALSTFLAETVILLWLWIRKGDISDFEFNYKKVMYALIVVIVMYTNYLFNKSEFWRAALAVGIWFSIFYTRWLTVKDVRMLMYAGEK